MCPLVVFNIKPSFTDFTLILYAISFGFSNPTSLRMAQNMYRNSSNFNGKTQLAHNSGPPPPRQRYAIEWRIAGGPLVARQCVLGWQGLKWISVINVNVTGNVSSCCFNIKPLFTDFTLISYAISFGY